MEQIVSEKPYIEETTDESIYYQRLSDGIPYQPSFRLIDLFCGAGGFSLGFSPLFGHHFQHVWMNDIEPAAVKTYRCNFESTGGHEDILKVAEHPEDIPTADVVIGGPPCQGFSLLNKNRENDPRKQLWRPFMEIVRISHASVFVMENVPQLLGSEEYNRIKTLAQDRGFLVTSAKLCAADYGVPQTRWRAFIIGCNFEDPKQFFPPRKTHFDPAKGNPKSNLFDDEYIEKPAPWRTVHDVISDLPGPLPSYCAEMSPPLDLHFGRNPTPLSQKRYRVVCKEGMNRFDLQRLAPELTPSCWIKKPAAARISSDAYGGTARRSPFARNFSSPKKDAICIHLNIVPSPTGRRRVCNPSPTPSASLERNWKSRVRLEMQCLPSWRRESRIPYMRCLCQMYPNITLK